MYVWVVYYKVHRGSRGCMSCIRFITVVEGL